MPTDRLRYFTGTPMWVLFHLGPIKNEKGEVMLFLVTLKDITEFKDPIVGTGNDIYFKLNYALSLRHVLNFHTSWRANPQFPQWEAPAGNHGSCIYHLGLDICFDEDNYHDSLLACLIEGNDHSELKQATTVRATRKPANKRYNKKNRGCACAI